MGILRFVGKLLSTLIWAIFMPFFAIGRWGRDIFYGVIMLRLFKNLKGAFLVAIVIPLFIYGTMNQMKVNASHRLEKNIDYVLVNEWHGDKIDVKVPSGTIGFVFTREEAMKIAQKAVERHNYRAKARRNNRSEKIHVKPNVAYDQFIKVSWDGGNLLFRNQ